MIIIILFIYIKKSSAALGKITESFSLLAADRSTEMDSYLRTALKQIKEFYNKCKPVPSLPGVYPSSVSETHKKYHFVQNLLLDEMITIQSNNKRKHKEYFDIIKQIMHYSGKIIGVWVKYKKRGIEGYIPCFPSNVMPEPKDIIMVDSAELWKPYEKTKAFLEEVYTISHQKIPSKPKIQVISDKVIVGIITITNQFVPVKPSVYAGTPDDNLEILEQTPGLDYLKADRNILTSDNIDEERVEQIKMIHLENNFL